MVVREFSLALQKKIFFVLHQVSSFNDFTLFPFPPGTTLPTDLTLLAEKSEDLIDLVESHTSCSCEQERCVA